MDTGTGQNRNSFHLPADGFSWEEWEFLCDSEVELFRGDDSWIENELELCAVPLTLEPDAGFLYWVTKYWFLVDKSRRKRRLVPNPLQRSYLSRRTTDNVILKYRKGGASTIVDALYYWRCLFRSYQHAYIMAHEATSTDELYQRVVFAHDHLPDWMRPALTRSSRKEALFAANRSHLRVMTAGGKGMGRGADADAIHMSEFARYPDPRGAISGLDEARTEGSWLDIESTAQGFNEFRDEYTAAREGRSNRTSHFFRWWEAAEHRLDLRGEVLELTKEEASLVGIHGLDHAQIAWRRRRQQRLRDEFEQEHPENDETCFRTSGVPRFNVPALQQLLAVIESEPREIEGGPFGGSDGGHFKLWKSPIAGRTYTVGADVAEGLPPDGDYSAAVVLDDETGEQCAAWHGWISPGDFAEKLAPIGVYFNTAKIAVERNNHGHATLRALRMEQGYENIYRHRHYDQRTKSSSRRMGWPTDAKTRPLMLSSMRDCLDNGYMTVYDPDFVRECITFQSGDEALSERPDSDDKKRKRGVKRDRIFANMIAWEVRKQAEPQVYS